MQNQNSKRKHYVQVTITNSLGQITYFKKIFISGKLYQKTNIQAYQQKLLK